MKLIVTRPPAQAAAWVSELQALGQSAQALPLIDIAPAADAAPLRAAWQRLSDFALVMFVSANAVVHFFALRPAGAPWPTSTRAAATGPGTSRALREAGLSPDTIVEPAADAPAWDSESLWARLAHEPWASRRVLVVRGEDGRDWLAETLRGRGATVAFVAAYRRVAPQPDAAGRTLLVAARLAPDDFVWLFSSSEALVHLAALAPAADWSRSGAIASHPRIADAARRAGFGRVDVVAPDPAQVAQRAAAWRPIQSASP